MTVQSLCQQMSQRELCHWMAHYKIKGDKDKEDSETTSTANSKDESSVDNPVNCARVFGFLKNLSNNGNLPPTPRSKKK